VADEDSACDERGCNRRPAVQPEFSKEVSMPVAKKKAPAKKAASKAKKKAPAKKKATAKKKK
jgi:hypothetical protein